MMAFLVLALWMMIGALGAARLSPAGAWPMAVIFGPLWLPIALETENDVPQD